MTTDSLSSERMTTSFTVKSTPDLVARIEAYAAQKSRELGAGARFSFSDAARVLLCKALDAEQKAA